MRAYIVYVVWDGGPRVYTRMRDARRGANGQAIYRAILEIAFPVQGNGKPVAPRRAKERDQTAGYIEAIKEQGGRR